MILGCVKDVTVRITCDTLMQDDLCKCVKGINSALVDFQSKTPGGSAAFMLLTCNAAVCTHNTHTTHNRLNLLNSTVLFFSVLNYQLDIFIAPLLLENPLHINSFQKH